MRPRSVMQHGRNLTDRSAPQKSDGDPLDPRGWGLERVGREDFGLDRRPGAPGQDPVMERPPDRPAALLNPSQFRPTYSAAAARLFARKLPPGPWRISLGFWPG